ncbi:protein D2 isoform X2 [Bemisia tabaci]|uniref:protein D2 isoform X2 n=1 Tax=Bemisia tabaci TaxID=7038 RepID=UPI0008F9AA12|nr:PREDICTED: protein D2-like isoform X1 [Bemisia tabaci]
MEVVFTGTNCPEDGRLVNFGNEIDPAETKEEPSIEWPADPNLNYALVFIDPDAPSKALPTMREWQHWLVVNIPGNDITSGKVLTEYEGASPPNGTGPHRYVFVVYQQPRENMTFDEPTIMKGSEQYRAIFCTKSFADENKLGKPIAVNFFQSEVPKREEDLSLIDSIN